MSHITLRPAFSTDAGKTAAIMSNYMEDTLWMPRVHTGAEDIGFLGLMIDRGWVTVAMSAGKVVGFVARDGANIQALYVEKNTRRLGCGALLLAHAKADAEKLSLWSFQGNTDAQAFYTANGFCEVERTDGAGNDENLPDIRFERHREAV